MTEETRAGAADDKCQRKLAEISERQAEFDALWLKMSSGDTSGARRYRELRHILDDLRATYRRTCGELTESSELPRSVLADWRS
jgi:hypothetical protein